MGVAHFDHRLRGAESDREREFVRRLADRYGLPCHQGKGDFKRDLGGQSLQMAARKQRYEFFHLMMKEHGYDRLATGHNLNDQAETVFMALMRNYGWKGLAGIRPIKGNYIHPLLCLSRREIIQYAESKGIDWMEDSSNLKLNYLRNRVRHQLMPQIIEVFPGAVEALSTLAEDAGGIADWMDSETDEIWRKLPVKLENKRLILEINDNLTYFSILGKLLLSRALKEINPGYHPSPRAIHELAKLPALPSGRKVMLGEIEVYSDRGRLIFQTIVEPIEAVKLDLGSRCEIGDYVLECTPISLEAVDFAADAFIEYIDLDKICGGLSARGFEPGDRFRPLGFSGGMKVSDFLINRKVSMSDKQRQIIVTDEEKVIWVCGLRLDDRVKIDNNTRRAGRLQIKANEIG